MTSIRQEMEDCAIAVIRAHLAIECNPAAGYLRKVGPYNGEIDQTDGPEDFLRLMRGQFPFVLVSATSSVVRSESVQRTRFNRVISFELYIGSDHMRTREDRLRKDVAAQVNPNADPGIYQILDHCLDLLAGNDLDIDCVGYFSPGTEQVLLQEEGFTVWRQQYNVQVDARVNKRDFGEFNFDRYRLNGNVDGDEVDSPPNPIITAEGDLTE